MINATAYIDLGGPYSGVAAVANPEPFTAEEQRFLEELLRRYLLELGLLPAQES